MLTIQDLKDQNLLLFECVSGSNAYGLALPHSDVDIKGVFVLPQSIYYGLDYIPQINDKKNDVVYYELRRFVELLYKNNPNILEMLNSPADCILYKHSLFDLLKPDLFLSKQCKETFAGYAMSQIKKARGLNKKIMNPMARKRKSVLDFCYVTAGQGAVNLVDWLEHNNYNQADCGLVNIPHMHDVYGLYYDENNVHNFQGIVRASTVDTVVLSSIPKGIKQTTLLYFNKDGYKKYCKDYKQYWDWVDKRNESRYQNTLSHGKNYDAKNMMHTFRLLDMAVEILSTGAITVKRPNRAALLAIRNGQFEYNDLVQRAEKQLDKINSLYKTSVLPDLPNKAIIEACLIQIRQAFYNEKALSDS